MLNLPVAGPEQAAPETDDVLSGTPFVVAVRCDLGGVGRDSPRLTIVLALVGCSAKDWRRTVGLVPESLPGSNTVSYALRGSPEYIALLSDQIEALGGNSEHVQTCILEALRKQPAPEGVRPGMRRFKDPSPVELRSISSRGRVTFETGRATSWADSATEV